MNLYKSEIKLTLDTEPTAAYAKTSPEAYFQERSDVCDHGLMLCAHGVLRYVKLPKSARQITLCFFKRRVAESFEIGRHVRKQRSSYDSLMFIETASYCMTDHPRVELLQSFRSELHRYYINGYKFFRIEY